MTVNVAGRCGTVINLFTCATAGNRCQRAGTVIHRAFEFEPGRRGQARWRCTMATKRATASPGAPQTAGCRIVEQKHSRYWG
jgi:hypothetical protein